VTALPDFATGRPLNVLHSRSRKKLARCRINGKAAG
jgi:hypothetical protein